MKKSTKMFDNLVVKLIFYLLSIFLDINHDSLIGVTIFSYLEFGRP